MRPSPYPPGLHELVQDDDGDMICVASASDGGDAEVREAESFFGTVVYQHDESRELFTMDEAVGKSSLVSLTDRIVRHRSGEACVYLLGGSSAIVKGFVFVRPRPGCQVLYWSLHDIYALLQLKCFKQQASKWVATLGPRWDKALSGVAGGTQLVLGSYCSDNSAKRKKMSWSDRCLPVSSISSFGLVVQLLKWSMLSKQAGGLEDDDSRSSASRFLTAICDTIASRRRAWKLTVFFRSTWACVWPRPSPVVGDDAMDLQVSPDGKVDLQPLLKRGAAGVAGAIPAQFAAIAWTAGGRCATDAPVLALMRAAVCSNKKAAASLCMQVCWVVSQQLQLAMGAQALSKEPKRRSTPAPPVEFRYHDDASGIAGGAAVDKLLAGYVMASATAIGEPTDFFVATDKGSIGCMNLQISLFGTNSNLAVVACPQVLPVWPRSLSLGLALSGGGGEGSTTT